MSESDRICPHCSMYACGTVGPEDMCDGALRAKLAAAEARDRRCDRALCRGAAVMATAGGERIRALEAQLREAEARAERYAAALREILGKASCTCSEDWRGRKDERCAGQIARAALAPPADGKGGE